MASTKTDSPIQTPSPTPVKSKSKFTNWEVFKTCKVAPISITCEGYFGFHAFDNSCHSKLVPTAQNILNHINQEHGGGFEFELRPSNKVSPLWDELAAAGLELLDFRCGVCGEILVLQPQTILKHLKTHRNGFRRNVPGGKFYLTLGFGTPDGMEDPMFDPEAYGQN